MAHAQKPDFVFRRNGRVHLNRKGASVQSTTGSRGVRISGSNAGYFMFRGSVKSTGYPLHSPVPLHFPYCASPCAIIFQLDSNPTIHLCPVAHWTFTYSLANNAYTLCAYKFIICLYMFRALCAHHQEVKIVLYSLWYHHTCAPDGHLQV